MALPAGMLVLFVMVMLLVAGSGDLSRFTTSRRLQQLSFGNNASSNASEPTVVRGSCPDSHPTKVEGWVHQQACDSLVLVCILAFEMPQHN